MKSLVVGGGGFVGRPLVEALRNDGGHVISVGRSTGDLHADLTQAGVVDALIREQLPDQIVSLAGAAHGSTEELCRANVDIPVSLVLAIARHAPQARLILTGSAAEYGNPSQEPPTTESAMCVPTSTYGTTKLAGTIAALGAAKDLGISASVIRPFNIVGAGAPEKLVTGALIQRILNAPPGGTVKTGRTDTERDFVAVGDVVDAILGLLKVRPAPDVYNVSSGEPTSIGTLLNLIREVSGRDVRFEIDPALVRPDDVLVSYGSYAKLNALTGFEPKHTLREAVSAAWQAAVAKQAGAQ